MNPFESKEPVQLESDFWRSELTVLSKRLSAVELLLDLSLKEVSYAKFCHDLLLILSQALPVEASSVFVVDRVNRRIQVVAATGRTSREILDVQIPWGKGVVSHVIESKDLYCAQEVDDESMHMNSVSQALGFDVKNLVAAPIVVKGQVRLVIEWVNRIGTGKLSSDDLELVRYLSEASSKALELRLKLSKLAKLNQAEPDQNTIRRVA